MKPLQSIKIPHEIVNDEFVTIIRCHLKNGDKIREGDPLVTIETSKMVEDLYAEFDGYIYYRCQEGNEIKIGEVIIEIYDRPLPREIVFAEKTPKKKEGIGKDGDAVFSRSALRLLAELKLNKDLFKGRDFVTAQDVRLVQGQAGQLSGQDALEPSPDKMTVSPDIEFRKISPFKKREIEYLKEVQSSNLNNVVSMIIDVTPLIDELQRVSKFFKNSLLPIVLSKLPALLQEHPEFNAFYKDGTIGFYKNIALGIAVSLGDGLRVLRLPDTHEKSITEIEMLIFEITKQYVDKKLTSKDTSGVTFTITDLSKEGVHFFVPLIPKGQCAILGISSIDEKLQRSILSFSFDHRVTDGKKASEFLRKLKKRIEAYSGRG